ncbi:hypothetical protein [Poseidonibacter sp.]|uniref:hypothetical protein n=1 Tax=Poseidonibacter sp. TaxID=2321188 RepID=UPI003C749C2E
MKKPIYFIVAQPRGASTLLQQLLISNLHVGYISNYLATYYDSHNKGLILEKDILDTNYKSNFLSMYGNTEGDNEPHEWGWFWKEQLGLKNQEHYADNITYDKLQSSLNDILSFKELPLLIDNVYAMANLIKLKNKFRNIKVINLTRDLYFICNSIINARMSRYNNIEAFYGHPPKNIEEVLKIKNPIEQIVFQVKSIQNEINLIEENFNKNDILNIDYEDIYNDSFSVVNNFYKFVQQDNIELRFKEKHLPKLQYRNNSSLINIKYKDELDFYYNKYFGNKDD